MRSNPLTPRPAAREDLERLLRQHEQKRDERRLADDHVDKVREFGARYRRLQK